MSARRLCERCGKAYWPSDEDQRYCKATCGRRARKHRAEERARATADRLLPARRPTPAGPALLVAVDGSQVDRPGRDPRAGWAYFASADLHGYGRCEPGEFHELAAVVRLLDAVDPRQPLTLLTDNHEVIWRLSAGFPPRSSNPHVDAWWRAMAQVRRRPVTLRRVLPDLDPHPLHSVAHWLAFLGREGAVPASGALPPGAEDILAAQDPEAWAHALCRRAALHCEGPAAAAAAISRLAACLSPPPACR